MQHFITDTTSHMYQHMQFTRYFLKHNRTSYCQRTYNQRQIKRFIVAINVSVTQYNMGAQNQRH